MYTAKSTYTPAVALAAADSTAVTNGEDDPFEAWYGDTTMIGTDQLFFSFIDETDTEFTFQVGDT